MSANEIIVSNGPGKDDLLRAVASAGKHQHVLFHTASEELEAHIDSIDEEGLDGLRFALRGHLKSQHFRGAHFTGVYDAETRTGRLMLQQEAV
jgi:hypothetical protein